MQVLIKLRGVDSPSGIMITNLAIMKNWLQNANILLFCLFSALACPGVGGSQARPGQASVNSSHSLLSSPLLLHHQQYQADVMQTQPPGRASLSTSRIVSSHYCWMTPRREGGWGYDLSIFLWLLNVQKGCKNYFTLWRCLTV